MNKPRSIAIALPAMGVEEIEAVRGPIESGWLTQGPKVAAFEAAFSKRHGVAQSLATTSCTTALHLALAALGIGPGDEVIVPAFTWISTANVILYCGATPVFVDVLPDSYNIDPAAVAARVTERTRAVIAVHLFGLCADIDALRAMLRDDIVIVEDAACASGAAYKGRSAGSLGEIGCFSFHPRKTITTGEGGMVTTNDPELAARADMLRNHGASMSEEQRHAGPKPYLLAAFDLMGFNYRMTDLQGAIGLAQLAKLDRFIAEREKAARFYDEALADIDWLRPAYRPAGYDHGWQAYVRLVDPKRAPRPRNAMMEDWQKLGISTRPGTHAVHMLGFYRDRYSLRPDDYPVARLLDENSVALPLHNKMTEEDYAYVAKCLHDVK